MTSRTETPTGVVDTVVRTANAAARAVRTASPLQRADWLSAMADALAAEVDHLVPLAQRETRLPEARLRGELHRTVVQLRSFVEPLRTGELLEIIIDHADAAHPIAPSPDLRRMLVGLGPVAVFAASNFPFAFSVAGGDTASAIAAGCPVVVKAHPGHPELSRAVGDILTSALHDAGAPHGTIAVIEGFEAGLELIRHPLIAAASFTGSTAGGVALARATTERAVPIPFYGELGSVNPVFVTRKAALARADEIATGFVASLTLGVGQFCTKPGVLVLPAGTGITDRVVEAARGVGAAPLLTDDIASRLADDDEQLSSHAGVMTLLPGTDSSAGRTPQLVLVELAAILAAPDLILDERFGPSGVIVEVEDESAFATIAALFEGTLTATVHLERDEPAVRELMTVLEERSGRVIINGWPTGVSVSASMHHGGVFPAATNPLHTSVGITAARRFQRPLCWQSVPEDLLPIELHEANPWHLVRRVDGTR